MKKLKVKKAGFGSIVNIFKDLIGQVSNNGVIEKAFLGKLFKGKGSSSSDGGGGAFGMFNFADLFRRAGGGNNVIGGDSSAWSKDKMEGLRKYAPGSYGSGKQTGQQTAKASKGKFIVGKGSDYIKDLL
jgi:hypothetical protein